MKGRERRGRYEKNFLHRPTFNILSEEKLDGKVIKFIILLF